MTDKRHKQRLDAVNKYLEAIRTTKGQRFIEKFGVGPGDGFTIPALADDTLEFVTEQAYGRSRYRLLVGFPESSDGHVEIFEVNSRTSETLANSHYANLGEMVRNVTGRNPGGKQFTIRNSELVGS